MITMLQNHLIYNNLGLHNGKMGYCLALFIFSKANGSREIRKEANKLLNEIGAHINQVEDYSFENGLLGIGWAIEWIAQQKYLKIDTNNVLEDLDDEIYKLILFSKSQNIGLANGALGRTLYLYKRITSKKPQIENYRQTSLLECLCLTIDEIYETLTVDENGLLNKKMIILESENQDLLSQVLIMLLKLYPLKFNYIVDELVEKIIDRMSEWIYDLQDVNPKQINYLCLNSFLRAGIVLNNKIWVDRIKAFLLSKKINENQLLNDITYSFKKDPIRYQLFELSKLTKDYSWQEGWLTS